MSQIAQGPQNTAGAPSPAFILIQSTSEACMYSLGSPLPYPNKSIHKPVTSWVIHTHICRCSSHILLQYKHHPDTLMLSESFPLEQLLPKTLYLCWNSRHQSHLSLLGQQAHPKALDLERTTSYPTAGGQVFVFLSEAHIVLWRKSSVGSYKHCQAATMTLTMPSHLSGAISFLPIAAQ